MKNKLGILTIAALLLISAIWAENQYILGQAQAHHETNDQGCAIHCLIAVSEDLNKTAPLPLLLFAILAPLTLLAFYPIIKNWRTPAVAAHRDTKQLLTVIKRE